MGRFWRPFASDTYRLCYDRSLMNLFRGREVPVDAKYVPHTEKERARLEIFCDSVISVVDQDYVGRSYTPRSKSSRLAIQEIADAGLDRAELKRQSIVERLGAHGVQFAHLWAANRDQVKAAYADAFQVLLAELCDRMGVYTGFVFESDAKQEEIMKLINPVERVVMASLVPPPNAVKVAPAPVQPTQNAPQPPKTPGSS